MKYKLTLEVEVNPHELSGGMPNGYPDKWNWQGWVNQAQIGATVKVVGMTMDKDDFDKWLNSDEWD